MKIRIRYVSNSSSSSYLIVCDDPTVFSFLDHEDSMSLFFFLKDDEWTGEDLIKYYLGNDFGGYYGHMLTSYLSSIAGWERDMNIPPDAIDKFCGQLGIKNDRLDELVEEGKRITREFAALNKQFLSPEGDKYLTRRLELSKEFASIASKELFGKWKHVFIMSFSDEDEKKSKLLAEKLDSEMKKGGKFSIIDLNE